MNSKHYAYRVIWSEEDQEFVGLCAEFPSLSWLEKDQEAALRGIVSLVKGSVNDMESKGEKIPVPLKKLRSAALTGTQQYNRLHSERAFS